MSSDSYLVNSATSIEPFGSNAAASQERTGALRCSFTGKMQGKPKVPADGSYFVSSNPEMLRIRKNAGRIANFDIPVLILGESGTGKDVLARHIHSQSSRAERAFLKVNCAAFPETLLESELFGYERGAFTGAFRSKPGQFEVCNQGTIFLDEIAEMPPFLQAKLLHVLQDKCFYRLGGHERVSVDVRILAATNVDVGEAIKSQKLREDLYYRLNTFMIQLPPLRSRPDEIPFLLEHFVRRFASEYACPVPALSQTLIQTCVNHAWPGNVRELQSFVHRLLIQGDEELTLQELQSYTSQIPTQDTGCEERPDAFPRGLKALGRDVKCSAEKAAIAQVLRDTHYNRKVAAQRLKISGKALLYKIHQYGLVWKASQVEEREKREFMARRA